MQLKLSPCTLEDMKSGAFNKVMFSSFANDHLNRAIYGDEREAGEKWSAEKTFEAEGFDPSERTIKVVDEDTGEFVGVAQWKVPHKFTEEETKRLKESPLNAVPPMGNQKLLGDFFNEMFERRGKNTDKEKDFVLHLLTVIPTYQGKGVGGLLIRWGLEHADEADAQCYVEASPAGYPIYKKFGWRDTHGTIDRKLEDYGYEEMKGQGDGVHRTACMMRPRKSERA